MAAKQRAPKGDKSPPKAQRGPSVEKRKGGDRRVVGRRIDQRRKFGFGEIIPERRLRVRRDAARRTRKRR